jgi:hypothetical protein
VYLQKKATIIDKKNNTAEKSKDRIFNDNKKYIIKFELLLIYYNLYTIYTDNMMGDYFYVIIRKMSFLMKVILLIKRMIYLLYYIVMFPKDLIKYFLLCKRKINLKKRHKKLFCKLYDIDEKYLNTNLDDILTMMKSHVTDVEIDLDNIIYKVYFPILSKSKSLRNNPKYLNVQSSELENYIYFILYNYDSINIENTQNDRIDHYFELPLIRFIVANINMLKTFSLLIAILANVLILASYSNFNKDQLICQLKRYGSTRFCTALLYNIANNKRIFL